MTTMTTKKMDEVGEDGSLEEVDAIDAEMLKDPVEVERMVVELMANTGASREDATILITGIDPEDGDDE